MAEISKRTEALLELMCDPVRLKKFQKDKAKFAACDHNNVQEFTEYCLDCGFNTYDGPDPKDY